MFKKRIAVAVMSAMATGYRRAGFALEQGHNDLEATEEQIQLLAADSNLTVVAEGEFTEGSMAPSIASPSELIAKNSELVDENNALKNQVFDLEQQLKDAIELAATKDAVTLGLGTNETHSNTAADLAGVGERTFGFDCCTAPEELHHWIAVIDDLNKEAPLTKKPNCDHLTITVEGEPLTPTAAQRDAAWEWYQNNIVIASTDSTTETGE